MIKTHNKTALVCKNIHGAWGVHFYREGTTKKETLDGYTHVEVDSMKEGLTWLVENTNATHAFRNDEVGEATEITIDEITD